MKKHIFTITAGCAPVGDVMIESFLKHHPNEHINRYCFIEDLGDAKKEIQEKLTTHILPNSFKEFFLTGHEGTAKVWERVICQNWDAYIIQIDSDVVFKKESISLIEKQGYPDIYGSRRCYKNNPSGVSMPDGIEDAISTYFVGLNPAFLPEGNLAEMIIGRYNPTGVPILDFFDAAFFYMRSKGASVFYEDVEIIGGQNTKGLKINSFKSNLHLDMGSHLAHFGGVGSGYMALKDDSKMVKSYSDWAKHRWDFFNHIFYEIYKHRDASAVYDSLGRWVDGPYDDFILNEVLEDLRSESIKRDDRPAVDWGMELMKGQTGIGKSAAVDRDKSSDINEDWRLGI